MRTLRISLPVLLCLLTVSLFGQPRDRRGGMEERRENIESMKIAFLTRKLDLTPDEAKRFWPVYNQFTDEVKKIRDDRKDRLRDARGELDNMNDKDVEKLIDGEIVFRQQEVEIIKKYHGRFKEVLPMKKVARLYRAEEEFKRELIERIKERKGSRP